MDNRLIVQGQGTERGYEAKLSCVKRDSFYIQWEKNSSYQLQFTAFDDGSSGYSLLTPEASLFFRGQEFIIKQIAPDYNSGASTKDVVATHVYSECQWFRQRNVRNGVLTYTPQDVMSFVFDGNSQGFTYEIIGKFPSNQIENLGNMSGQDALSKIIETWSDAIIFPDNRHIKIYQHDSFIQDLGHRLGYLYNASEIKPTYDSTTITNQVWCTGKAKDKPDDADDNTSTEYYFEPFQVSDQSSIDKWGVHQLSDISDDRFTDANSMKQYALSQLTLEPSLTIDATLTTHDEPTAGDMVHMEVRKDNLATKLEVVSYQYYPQDRSQPTQITLNNTAKTIFDYQRNLQNKVYSDVFNHIANNSNENGTSQNTNDGSSSNEPSSNPSQSDSSNNDSSGSSDSSDNSNADNWNAGSTFIDTSSNNGNISVDTMKDLKKQGSQGIISKLTEGTGYVNSIFDSHKANAEKVGMKFIGAYHFYRGDPVNEANYFLQQLRDRNISKDTLVILDVEAGGLSTNRDTLTNQMKQFYQVLINAGYTNTCDYSSGSWFDYRFNQAGKYKWIASYGVKNSPNGANAWQFTSSWKNQHIDASYSYNRAFV